MRLRLTIARLEKPAQAPNIRSQPINCYLLSIIKERGNEETLFLKELNYV